MGFLNIAIILRILFGFSKYFMQFLEISRASFGILGLSKILGFCNLPLENSYCDRRNFDSVDQAQAT